MSENTTVKMNLVFVYLIFVSLFFYSCGRDSYGNLDDTDNIKNYAEYELEEQEFKLLKIVDGLDKPWGLTFTNEENLLITEKGGRLIRVNLPSGRSFEVLHNIDSIEEGQGGLLDVLYHDEYLYFSYAQDKGSGKTTTSISRGKLINDEVVELELLFSAIPAIKSGKHFGCRLAIRDDMLYATIGERGQGMIAQDPTQHPGSIIRINLNGSIPNSNPKFNGKSDWLPEIYQIGVRNPQGMALSPTNGEIYISNHGAKGGDFIGQIEFSGNFGWKVVGWGGVNYLGTKIGEGNPFDSRFNKPLITWVPSIAPSDIVFYKGKTFKDWDEDLLVTSLKYKMLLRLDFENDKIINETIITSGKIGRIRDVDIDVNGDIYLITDEYESSLWKLTK